MDSGRLKTSHAAPPWLMDELRLHKLAIVALLSRTDRVSDLQELCPGGCGGLFVDAFGRGQCGACYHGTALQASAFKATEAQAERSGRLVRPPNGVVHA